MIATNLAQLFRSSASNFPGRHALYVDGSYIKYSQLLELAESYNAAISVDRKAVGAIGVYAQRSLPAYAGVLAATLGGTAFVPLNPRFPKARLSTIAQMSDLQAIIADENNAAHALDLCNSLEREIVLLLPATSRAEIADLQKAGPVAVICKDEFASNTALASKFESSPGDAAYIMFTSGSTGTPKGVLVSHQNVCTYVDSVVGLLAPKPTDRFTQLFDFSFDLSVHDLFVTWASGGCLYVMPQSQALNPISFVKEFELTHWFSVPATAAFALRLGQLLPSVMPSLRVSLFCGEALPRTIADSWINAAPNSALYNFYGPTEATIAFTTYRYQPAEQAVGGPSVPIGVALPDQETIVVRADGSAAADNEEGELYLGGSQLAIGYLNNEIENKNRFINRTFPNRTSERWYRTGDVAFDQPGTGLIFVGRIDDQVKINGYRVELFEIEALLRSEAGTALVAVVPWPINQSGLAEGLIGFACGATKTASEIIKACSKQLPFYMVPRKIIPLEEMPVTASGKIDRVALKRICTTDPLVPKR